MIHKLHQASRTRKKLLMLFTDIALLVFALWLAISIRTGVAYLPTTDKLVWFLLVPVIAVPIFIRMGMYRAVIQYMGMQAAWTIFASISLAALCFGVALLLGDPYGIPRSSLIIFWLIALLLVGGSRVLFRWWLRRNVVREAVMVAVYGAGNAGVQLASALKHAEDMKVLAFIDDNSDLEKHEVAGLKVYGSSEVPTLIEAYGLQQVLVAMPSATHSQRRKVLDTLAPYPIEVRTLPSLSALAKKEVQLDAVRDINIEDLLGRDAVAPDHALLQQNIVDKVVMVTGAGGSIGSEICRQILKQNPVTLILFEQSEFALYSIEKELRAVAEQIEIVPLLGSVTHQQRVEHVCKTFAVQTVYHAAAYKHVPLVEYNPIEGVVNNVLGTWRTAKVAVAAGVETFVLISTDKAVRPTNVMGSTKRLAELGLQALARTMPSTRICMVRFGNVLGSSGSVVPLFFKQIKEGGPVTVTHAEITRYFMSIPEASQLVIQAGAMAKGGDVFVLDMGDPIKIIDLAEKMILLSGLTVKNQDNPDGDIEIQCTGLRPGEKLYEELLIGDNVSGTQHGLIMRAEEDMLSVAQIAALEESFMEAARAFDVERIRELLLESVAGYKPQCGIQDLTYLRSQQ